MDDELKTLAEDAVKAKFGDTAGEAVSDVLAGNSQAAVSKIGAAFGLGGGGNSSENDDSSDTSDDNNSDDDDSNDNSDDDSN